MPRDLQEAMGADDYGTGSPLNTRAARMMQVDIMGVRIII